jgi:hypothetical protein
MLRGFYGKMSHLMEVAPQHLIHNDDFVCVGGVLQ